MGKRRAEDMDPQVWRGRFDRAVLYFNAGEYYEAHEDWEALWLEAEGAHRLWLQGLIQFAAAFLHYSRGFYPNGYWRLMHDAAEKVARYEGFTEHIRWAAFWQDLQPWIRHGEDVRQGAPLQNSALGDPPVIEYEEGYVPRPVAEGSESG